MGDRRGTLILTGASGRLGAALAGRLSGRFRVVAFSRSGASATPAGIETLAVDLGDDQSVAEGLAAIRDRHGDEVASVLHFAAYYDFTGEDDPRYEAINVEGSARLIRGLAAARLRVGQFVYASTMVVHAPVDPGRTIDEAAPLGPNLPYSRSKLRAEEALRRLRGDIPLVVLRLANVYDDTTHHPVLAQQVRRVFERDPTAGFFPGDPARGQSYLHAEDLLDAVDRIIDRRRELPGDVTFLLGEPGATPYEAIQRELGRLLRGAELPTRRVPKALAKLGAHAMRLKFWGEPPFLRPWMIDRADDHYALDVSRAREHLGWSPSRSLLGTLPAMAELLRNDPEGWYRANDLEPPS